MTSIDTLYTTLPTLGVSTLGAATTTPDFAPGTKMVMNDGGECVYVKAAAAITAGDVLIVYCSGLTSATPPVTQTVPGTAQGVTTTLISAVATSNQLIAVAAVDIASGSYGWAVVRGTCKINVAAACVLGVPLYTTAVAGQLDDAPTNGLISGLMTSVTAVGAGTMSGYASNPVYVRGTVAA